MSCKRLNLFCLAILLSGLAASVLAETKVELGQYALPDLHLNCTAWTFVAPSDWKKEGGVVWTGTLSPAYYTELKVKRPDGSREFRYYPVVTFAQTNNPALAENNEMRRYASPEQCIREIIIARNRRELRDYKIVAGEAVPEMAAETLKRAQAYGLRDAKTEAYRLRIEYDLGGKPQEEVYYCVNVLVPSVVTPLWAIDKAFSYRAEKGQLKEAFPILGTIAASMTESPTWKLRRRTEMQRIANYMAPPPPPTTTGRLNILDVSKSMARDNDDFLRGVDRSFQSRLNSPGQQAWSHAFRGTQTMENPATGQQKDVASGYLRYYQDNLGRIIGSNDMINDPYVNYGISVTELQPK